MGIKIKIKKFNKIPVFEIYGKISGGDAIKISKKLEAFIKKPFNKIILDLRGINFMDSNWLGVFIYCLRLYKEHDKELIFLITPGFVKDLFINSKIDTIATIIDSFDAL